MSTTTMDKPKRTKKALVVTAPPIAERFELVEVGRIRESHTNPRKAFKNIAELAASIAEKGIVLPLIVRPDPDRADGYELVAGARRLRAAASIGLASVPCVVRDYTDVQACEVQVIENNQREDVHPLEESDGFAHLVELGQDVATIAAKIGRPEAYVVKRLQLGKLISAARKLFEKETIGFGHALELARLSESAQERGVEWIGQCLRGWEKAAPSVTELRNQLARDAIRDLAEVGWKLDDAALLPRAGACTTCLKNTANQRALFDDVDAEKPHCTDLVCHDEKRTAFVQLSIAKVKDAGEEPILLANAYDRKALAKQLGREVHSRWSFGEVKPKEAKNLNGKVKKAVIVDGENAGKVLLVTEDDERSGRGESAADKRWKAEQKRKADAAARQKELNTRILDACLKNVDARFTVEQLRILVPAWWKRLWHESQKIICRRRGWKQARKGDYEWQTRAVQDFAAKADEQQLCELAVELALIGSVNVGAYDGGDDKKLMERAAEAFGVDADEIRRKAAAEQKTAAKAKAKGNKKVKA